MSGAIHTEWIHGANWRDAKNIYSPVKVGSFVATPTSLSQPLQVDVSFAVVLKRDLPENRSPLIESNHLIGVAVNKNVKKWKKNVYRNMFRGFYIILIHSGVFHGSVARASDSNSGLQSFGHFISFEFSTKLQQFFYKIKLGNWKIMKKI